jgi:Ni/Co efflux regulator RcnB
MKTLAIALLAGSLMAGAVAQTQTPPAQTDQGAGQDMKDAAHSTGHAAKKTGHKIKHGTKKAVHKTAHATKKGAQKVEGKTDDQKPQ